MFSCAFGLPVEACRQTCGRNSRPSPVSSSCRPLPTTRSPRSPYGPLSDGESFLVDEGSHFRLTLFRERPSPSLPVSIVIDTPAEISVRAPPYGYAVFFVLHPEPGDLLFGLNVPTMNVYEVQVTAQSMRS